MAIAPRSQRRQRLIDHLTALLPSSETFRRWLQRRTYTITAPETEKLTASPPTPPQPQPQPEHQTLLCPPPPPRPASPPPREEDPPTGLLMPGMAPTGSTLVLLHPSTTPNPNTPHTTVPIPFTHKPFVPPPPSTPDLILSALPLDVLLLILEQPVLSLEDLLSLRATCAPLRRVLPYRAVERKLTVRNYEGWRVVFEMGGNRYPGTTYGNRRLCGRCVLPRCRGGLIAGEMVQKVVGVWPGDKAMCFPCLWTVVVRERGEEAAVGRGMKVEEMARLAGISTKEEFLMLDGSKRKMCEKCCRDIHVNALVRPVSIRRELCGGIDAGWKLWDIIYQATHGATSRVVLCCFLLKHNHWGSQVLCGSFLIVLRNRLRLERA
ncbi:hypothetical protein QBC39DRAFT_26280 [Podospora conica]|nr:hypothetical protein QBC39DRAFT_26280 [Schizothecium conicum]